MQKKRRHMPPGKIISFGFGGTILIGALLLMLPIATRDHQGACFFDALFTATSATCVTGLVLHDTWNYWSSFGQMIILLLIQIGGMGVVTMAIAIFLFTGKKIGLKQRFVLQESISAPQVGGIVRMTNFIVKLTLFFEGTGALLLAIHFIPTLGFKKGLWFSIFHAISAFCNAGFDLMGSYGDFSSLTPHFGNFIINITIITLIICGGLGFFVWQDIFEHRKRFKVYRLHSKIVIITTGLLLLIPFLYFIAIEFQRPQWDSFTKFEKFFAALFQAVTPRTAGFNTVDLTLMTESTILMIIFLMLIGGSPGSTAGGYKTTTFAVLFLSIKSIFKKEEHLQILGRRLPAEVIRHAAALFFLYTILFLFGGALICAIDEVSLTHALFETASAIGTVGLSLGLTPTLSRASHIILIALMFFGRIGGLTIIYAFTGQYAPSGAQFPQEKITIG